MGEWINPAEAEIGMFCLAWVWTVNLPFYRLLERRSDHWIDYWSDKTIPAEWIIAVMKLPEPPIYSKD